MTEVAIVPLMELERGISVQVRGIELEDVPKSTVFDRDHLLSRCTGKTREIVDLLTDQVAVESFSIYRNMIQVKVECNATKIMENLEDVIGVAALDFVPPPKIRFRELSSRL